MSQEMCVLVVLEIQEQEVNMRLLPINIEFKEWAAQIRIDFPNVTIPLPPDDVNDWRDWAAQTSYSNQLFNVPLPTKIAYPNKEDWRSWGSYFINSIS